MMMSRGGAIMKYDKLLYSGLSYRQPNCQNNTFMSSVQGTTKMDHPSPSAAIMHSSHQVHRCPLEAWHHHSPITLFILSSVPVTGST